jgi:hypothetical protein
MYKIQVKNCPEENAERVFAKGEGEWACWIESKKQRSETYSGRGGLLMMVCGFTTLARNSASKERMH